MAVRSQNLQKQQQMKEQGEEMVKKFHGTIASALATATKKNTSDFVAAKQPKSPKTVKKKVTIKNP